MTTLYVAEDVEVVFAEFGGAARFEEEVGMVPFFYFVD